LLLNSRTRLQDSVEEGEVFLFCDDLFNQDAFILLSVFCIILWIMKTLMAFFFIVIS